MSMQLGEPTFVTRPAFTVAGFQARIKTVAQIHALWQQLIPIINVLTPIINEPHTSYGVMRHYDMTTDLFDYLAGVAIDYPVALPIECDIWHVPAQRYAVFASTLATITPTFDMIFNEWRTTTHHQIAEGPRFEYYTADFMGQPDSQVQLYIPIVAVSAVVV